MLPLQGFIGIGSLHIRGGRKPRQKVGSGREGNIQKDQESSSSKGDTRTSTRPWWAAAIKKKKKSDSALR